MVRILLLIIVMIFASEAYAAEERVDCLALQKEIKTDLDTPATCWKDEDCVPISWGCPWQFSPCHFSAYSTSEEERYKTLSDKITQYTDACVNKSDFLRQKCDTFNYDFDHKQCHVQLDLICLHGTCSTPVDVIVMPEGEEGNNDSAN